MKTYELTYIISSSVPLTEVDAIRQNVESAIKAGNGVIFKAEKTAATPLAYPVTKQHSGYFSMVEFQLPAEKVTEFSQNVKKEAAILRHLMTIKKPAKVMKERRTRKKAGLFQADGTVAPLTDDKKKGEKVEMEEINKKLDELLSE